MYVSIVNKIGVAAASIDWHDWPELPINTNDYKANRS